MVDSKRALKRLSHESWELQLSVDSTHIESLKWVWTAEVSVEDGPNDSTIAIAPAAHTAVGMPVGDRTGDHSYSPKLTGGARGIPVSGFESVLDQWEQECRHISSVFDSSVINRRRVIERQTSEEDRKAENRQNAKAYLDSLATDDPDP